jgi:hypothetical protein
MQGGDVPGGGERLAVALGVERDVALALEAPLQVVAGLPVPP